ncbi:MAG: hypothetical protein OJF55_001297 [Rhodanobacteraceae bacterium]|nr:MAG: hypothetical protein OJF55_001297 [Rhodanobacteraceae bacterium]
MTAQRRRLCGGEQTACRRVARCIVEAYATARSPRWQPDDRGSR